MKAQLVYTADTRAISSWAICRASGGRLSHVLIMFTVHPDELRIIKPFCPPGAIEDILDEQPGDKVRLYFESISKIDERTGKTGVRGPYSFNRVVAWRTEGAYTWLGHPRNSRTIEIQELPFITSEQAQIMMRLASNKVSRIEYAKVQIFRNWLGYRFGRGVPLNRRSRTRWTCVEFAVWLIAQVHCAWAIKHLDLGYILFDEYCPSGRRGPGLFEKVESAR
jgi:hypothetical protein